MYDAEARRDEFKLGPSARSDWGQVAAVTTKVGGLLAFGEYVPGCETFPWAA